MTDHSKQDRDELRQQIWEFVYELLDEGDAAAMQERITSEPDMARLYAEIKQQSGLLAEAAKLEQPPVSLTPPDESTTAASESAEKKSKPAAKASTAAVPTSHVGGNWFVAIAASLVLAFAGYTYFGPESPLNEQAVARFEQKLEEEQPHIFVTAPSRLQVEAENPITVQVASKDGEPKPARIEYTAYETRGGKQMFQRREAETNELGQAIVSIPGDTLVGPVRVEMTAHYDNGKSKRIDTHLDIDEQRFATHLSLDKPLYRPGETVYYRSLTLSRFGMWPSLTEVEFEILDPGGSPVPDSKQTGATEQGVGNGAFDIQPGSPGGTYTLVARSPVGLFPEEEREFQVREYRPPQFKKELELIRDSYAPGDEVTADFSAVRNTGEPIANRNVFVMVTVDGESVSLPNPKGLTDDDGTYRVKFTLPEQIEKGEGSLVVTIDDGANRETIAETIPINLGKVEVDFYPEGGDLAADMMNRVYFSARDPVGEPVHIEGRIVDSAGKEVAKIETEHEGRGRFEFKPSAVDVYKLEIDSPADVTSTPELPAARTDLEVVMAADEFVYDAKQPITIALQTKNRNRRYVVAAMCRGAQVGQVPVTKSQFKSVQPFKLVQQQEAAEARGLPGTAKVAIPVSDAAFGVVRLTVYDYSQTPPQPVAERLVYRESNRKLNVQIGGHSESYSPGAPVKFNVMVTDENGEQVPAVVGVSVVDDSLLNLADDKSPQLTTHFMLTTEVDSPEDLEDANFFLSDDADAPSALDLLLGVQGWRRFANTQAEIYAAFEQGNFVPPPIPGEAGFGGGAPADDSADEENHEEAIARLAIIDGIVEPPQAADNTDSLAAELATAVSDFHAKRGEQIRQFGWILAGAALFVLLAIAMVTLLRKTSGFVVWSPAMLAAIGCLALGVLWTRAYVEPGTGEIAYAPVSLNEPGDLIAMNQESATVEEMPMPTTAAADEAMDPFDMEMAGAEAPEEMPADAGPLLAVPKAAANFAVPIDPGAPPVPLVPAPNNAPLADDAPGLGGEGFAPGQIGGGGFADNARGGARAFGAAPMMQADPPAILPPGEPLARPERPDAFRPQRMNRDGNARRALKDFANEANDLAEELRQIQFPVRIYAHKYYVGKPQRREDFQKSLYWNPLLIVGKDQPGEVSFELSDAITMFRVRLDAHTQASDSTTMGRIGSGSGEVISRLPFRVEPKLPIEVTTGDRIDLPVAVINDSRNELDVAMNIIAADSLTLADAAPREVKIAAGGRDRQWYALDVTGRTGDASITLIGESEFLRDEIIKNVRITQPGFPIEESYAGTIDGAQQMTIDLPESWIEGSLEVTLKAFPSTLADMQKGIDSILREPHGCFEQTSSSNYPNIMALQYMQEHDVADPAFTRRAKDLLDKGYQKLISFESPKDGYEWFGGDPGHEALTAYGLMEFRDMLDVYDVDEQMIQRTAEWLLARRDGTGGFRRNQRALDTFGRAPEQITNAYIVWALTEAGREDINTELIQVIGQAEKSDDPYLIALAARSALNADKQKQGLELLEKLTKLQADDGSLDAKESTITRSGGISKKVEATAIGVLAWLKHPSGTASARKGVEWITSSRQGGGGFGSTQATIMALKALTEYSSASRKTTSAGELLAKVVVKEDDDNTLEPTSEAEQSEKSTGEVERSDEDTGEAEQNEGDAGGAEPSGENAPDAAASREGRGSDAADAEPSIPQPPPVDGKSGNDASGEEDVPVADPAPDAETATDEPVADEPDDKPTEPKTITQSVTFGAGDAEAIELGGLEALLKAGKNELTIDLTGDNQMPYVLDIRYRVEQPRSDDACPVRLTTKLASESVTMGESVSLAVTLENISGSGQPMTTAIIGIPAGLSVRVEQLDEMKKAGKFAYYELNAREVILYWRDLAPEVTGDDKFELMFDLLAEVPGKYTGPASRAYLYYTAEQKQWLEPLVVEVTKPEEEE